MPRPNSDEARFSQDRPSEHTSRFEYVAEDTASGFFSASRVRRDHGKSSNSSTPESPSHNHKARPFSSRRSTPDSMHNAYFSHFETSSPHHSCKHDAGRSVIDSQPVSGHESFESGDNSTAGHDEYINPPRLPRRGFEWVWFPAGYWAERPIYTSEPCKPRATKATENPKKRRLSRKRVEPDESPYTATQTRRSHLNSNDIAAQHEGRPHENEIDNEPLDDRAWFGESLQTLKSATPCFPKAEDGKEGLYCKAKRSIGLASSIPQVKVTESAPVQRNEEAKDKVSMTLKGTDGPLLMAALQNSTVSSAPSIKSREISTSDEAKAIRRKNGWAPWNRRGHEASLRSKRSSLRQTLMGDNPPAAPMTQRSEDQEPEAKGLPKLDLLGVQKTFLISEAQRIVTPSIAKVAALGRSKGFFYDIETPGSDKDSNEAEEEHNENNLKTEDSQHSIKESAHRTRSKFQAPRAAQDEEVLTDQPRREWWDVANVEEASPAEFVASIPEHLPSSPLCPMNPKHPSGGAGNCIYHGRQSSQKHASSKLAKRGFTGVEL